MSGSLRLPHCAACGRFHWPPREACPHCHDVPDTAMGWADAAGDGTVLATTRLHVTLDPAFAADLPLSIGSVALDAGPVVLAFLGEGLAPGARVALVEADDSAGRSVFRLARP